MQRARRFASIAVVASLAVAGLSACRSEPSVAAYLGDDGRITEKRVQEVWDDAHASLAAQPPAAAPAGEGAQPGAATDPAAMPITRTDIVRTLISADVLGEVAQRQSVALPANLPIEEYATQLRLPPTAEYVRLYAESDAYIRLLRDKARNGPEPSDEDLRRVYDVLIAAGQIDPNMPFERFKTSLPTNNRELVKTSAAVRNEVAEVAGEMRIKVNPRYQPLQIAILEFQTQNGELEPLVNVPLGANTDDSPVTDVS